MKYLMYSTNYTKSRLQILIILGRFLSKPGTPLGIDRKTAFLVSVKTLAMNRTWNLEPLNEGNWLLSMTIPIYISKKVQVKITKQKSKW